MAKILAFSFFPALLPARSGGEVRLFALYEALSHHHDVTLITSGELGAEPQILQHTARFREVRVPKGDEFAHAWAKLTPEAGAGDLSGPCLAASAMRPSLLLQTYLEWHPRADVIIHDSPFTAEHDLFLGHDGKPRIYNSYNVEFDLYEKLHADAPSRRIVELVADCEKRLVRAVDLITACSDDDLTRFSRLYDPSAPAMLLPNGVSVFAPPKIGPDSKRLVFIGSAHHPNQTAAVLIREVLAPALPDHEFHIMGRCLEPGRPLPNLISHGLVDDVTKARLFTGALACINPMLEGGGSSLKIPDMAAHGVPLISTELGARGYDLVAGQHYSLVDPADALASVRRALANPQQLVKQAAAAADHFARQFTWPQIARRLAERIDALLAKKQPSCRRIVALNDYDPFAAVGGGCTRIRGLYDGATDAVRPIILSFSDSGEIVRREVFGGKGLVIAIPKTPDHRQRDIDQANEFHVSTADIVAMEMAPYNPLMTAAFKATEGFTDLVACEHPYMATLLLGTRRKFVYSSQNYETALKRQLLAYHPRRDWLISSVAMIERFCVGCSDLVVAVSDTDAAAFAAEYDLVAPLVVVSNGADDPQLTDAPFGMLPGFNACFLGSGHLPNFHAVQFIVEELASAAPDVTFHIAGSVCDGIEVVPGNVRLHGRLDEAAKTRLLMGCQLALNPMAEGSGSNVKVADYLMHGLRVLSTPFGARGYDGLQRDDLTLVSLDNFAGALARLARSGGSAADRDDRRRRFAGRFSMRAFGTQYGALIARVLEPRRRALFVTYRYNAPPRGGGEFYVNRLVLYLADAGVSVDVLTPKVDAIIDSDRFASRYPSVAGAYTIPWGNAGIRVAKFETAELPDRTEELRRTWAEQPAFEKALFSESSLQPEGSGLLWGWTYPGDDGRWTMSQFATHAARPGRWRLVGNAPGKRYLVAKGSAGQPVFDGAISGDFDINFEGPAGPIEFTLFFAEAKRPDDPRPLGVFVKEVSHDAVSLCRAAPLSPRHGESGPLAVFHAMHRAAQSTRAVANVSLADLRGPFSPDLESFLAEQIEEYDLVITHNIVFRTTRQAIEAAKRAGVPSIVVPHAHFEDDYYHFPDVMSCISDATRALVTPPAACAFLRQIGHGNVDFLSPGIDGQETFCSNEEAAFRALYPKKDPFVLIAGRKAEAKGYRDVIAAVGQLRAGLFPELRVVMIGPDDDGSPVHEDFVDCLGMVERSVLRGAYRACAVLANMSRSESFGIVLLEAGLAGRPVVANAACAAFAELVTDGHNGYLATPATLADRLGAVLADPSLAAAMGANGRERAMEYDWNQIGARFVDHCYQVMDSQRTARR